MNNTVRDTVRAYFRQQVELGTPDYYVASPEVVAVSDAEAYTALSARTGETHFVSEPGETYETKRAALVDLYNEVKGCMGCGLGARRKKLVFGAGNAGAPLMIIGEAPGYDEDQQGKPFVGKAGVLLTKMLAAIQLDREKHVFITNILKCRPPENRDPDQTESLACMPVLKRQIAIIKPKVILALGRIAAHELLQSKESLGAMRAETYMYNTIPVIVTYHPAALLRSEKYKRPTWEDLQKLQVLLQEKGAYGDNK